ncbi:MAG: tetratricopeptide repeat protein [Gammaproteobacteria bacterium]|nr:tetratricopeptide repeat protein [Gammaproteobacteria bacterium]
MQNLDTLLPHLEHPARVVARLLEHIRETSVDASQIPDLLEASCNHLDTLERRLDDLYQHTPQDSNLKPRINNLKSLLKSSKDFSLLQIASGLADLQGMTETMDASVPAMLRECQALASAAMQDNLSGAEFCRLGSETGDMDDLQKWQLLHLEALLLGDQGREFGDDSALQSAIELLRSQALILTQKHKRTEQQAITLETLGTLLGIIGQRRSGTRYLEESVQAYNKALELCDPETTGALWASAQNGLGNALGALGQRQSDDELCNQAIEAFDQALQFRGEQKTPDEWASTLNNMAAVLHSLGRKNKDPKILKRAVDTYKEVLRVWTKSGTPLDWATAMFNLGTALSSLGEHRRGPRTLEQAIAAYNSALSIRSRELLPEQWAITQNNLGTALQKLSERENSIELMKGAIDAYQDTLKVWTQESMPMTWAMSMANLGVARRQLAEMSNDMEIADRAVSEISSAVKVFRGASHAKYTELGAEQLSLARQLLAKLIAEERTGRE